MLKQRCSFLPFEPLAIVSSVLKALMIFCTLMEDFMPSAKFKRFWNMHPVSSIFFGASWPPKVYSFFRLPWLDSSIPKEMKSDPFCAAASLCLSKNRYLRKSYLVPFQVLIHRVMGIELVLTLTTRNLLYWTQPTLKVKALSDHVVHGWHGWLQLSYFEGTGNR